MRFCGLLGGRPVNPGFTEARREAAVTSGGHIWPLTFKKKKKKRFLVETHLSSVCFFFFSFFMPFHPCLCLFFFLPPPPFGRFFIHCLDKCTRPFKITGAAPEGTVEQCDIPGNLRWLFKKQNKENEGARKSRRTGGSAKSSSGVNKIKLMFAEKVQVKKKNGMIKLGWYKLHKCAVALRDGSSRFYHFKDDCLSARLE